MIATYDQKIANFANAKYAYALMNNFEDKNSELTIITDHIKLDDNEDWDKFYENNKFWLGDDYVLCINKKFNKKYCPVESNTRDNVKELFAVNKTTEEYHLIGWCKGIKKAPTLQDKLLELYGIDYSM